MVSFHFAFNIYHWTFFLDFRLRNLQEFEMTCPRALGKFLLALTACGFLSHARADEGMWLYNQFPKKLLKEKYGFEPSDAWLDHVRLSSVR